MRGLWTDGAGVRFAPDLPEPETGRGEVRLEVLLAGICATDLALARGYMGFRGTPGHEFVGRALEGRLRGRRVVGEINAACGSCPRCESGLGRHCDARTVLGILGRPGAFAERLALPEGNLHELPDDLSDERAVFVEPLAAAFEIPEQVDLERVPRALVLGDGRLGLLCAQVLGMNRVAVDLAGRHPEHAAWLPDGIRHVGSPPAPGAGRFALVVEATGDPAAFPRALALVEPRGTLVLKTTSERGVNLDLAPLVVDEIQVQGSRCGPFAPAIRALARGDVIVDPMIAARYPLEEAPRAFERASAKGTLKVLFDCAPPP